MIWILALLLSGSLFAQVVPSTPNSAVFPIDPRERGENIISMFNTLNTNPPYKTRTSEVNIKTNIAIPGGVLFLQNIQKITPATYNTILAINAPVSTTNNTQTTTVVFVEQIAEMIYSINTNTGTTFTSTYPPGILPYFPMNLLQRSVDIQYMVARLKSQSGITTVTIGTTLSGPFYQAINTDGSIPNVQSVAVLTGTLLLVEYFNPGPTAAYIVVSPDQITSINYVTGLAL